MDRVAVSFAKLNDLDQVATFRVFFCHLLLVFLALKIAFTFLLDYIKPFIELHAAVQGSWQSRYDQRPSGRLVQS
jgi:hypothetical protein